MRVRYTAVALADLFELAQYALDHLDERSRELLGTTVREAVEGHLKRFPEMGKAGQVPGTRQLVLTRINVVVTYRVEGEELWVLSVLRTERER
jgi:plasmid stabilization system protein ParE